MPHTSALVFCRTFHIDAASVDIMLVIHFVLFSFQLKGTETGFCLSLLQDGSFNF